jgi:hypothetical protein
MIDRRGAEPHKDRKILHCSTCNSTSIFERVTWAGQIRWKCIGDQRGARPHPGCGKVVIDNLVRPNLGLGR